MKFKQAWFSTIALGMFGGLAMVAMLAAVPGIFSFVNSTNGYQVNGSVGSPGQALCSDGTYYSLPCSVAGSFVAGGDLSGSLTSQTVIGIQTHALPSLAPGFLQYDGSSWLYNNNFTPRTCNSNGCYEIINGTVHEWGHSITIADGSPGTNVCFPFAFPTGVDSAVVTDDFAVSATSTPSVAGLSPSSGASPFPCANGGLWVWGTRTGNAVYWSAWGH